MKERFVIHSQKFISTMKRRDQMADPSLFDCSKRLNLSDSLFDVPSGNELSNLLSLLPEFSENEAELLLSSKEDENCDVLPSFEVFDIEGFIPLTFHRTLEMPNRSHLDPDERRSLESYQVKQRQRSRESHQVEVPSRNTEKDLQFSPRFCNSDETITRTSSPAA
jgi:hypothetical protein